MRQLMCMQVRLLVEPFIAALIRANEWLLSSVDAHVRLQVEVQGEPLAAEMTLVRFLTCVH